MAHDPPHPNPPDLADAGLHDRLCGVLHDARLLAATLLEVNVNGGTSKTVTPSEIRLAVEWLAANANGVSLVDWEPRSQTLLTAADQIEATAVRESALQRVIDRHVRWRETALGFLRQVVDGRGSEDEWPALAEFLERSDSRMVESSPEKRAACDGCGIPATGRCPHCQVVTCGKCAVCEHSPLQPP